MKKNEKSLSRFIDILEKGFFINHHEKAESQKQAEAALHEAIRVLATMQPEKYDAYAGYEYYFYIFRMVDLKEIIERYNAGEKKAIFSILDLLLTLTKKSYILQPRVHKAVCALLFEKIGVEEEYMKLTKKYYQKLPRTTSRQANRQESSDFYNYRETLKIIVEFGNDRYKEDGSYFIDYIIKLLIDDICATTKTRSLFTRDGLYASEPFPSYYINEHNEEISACEEVNGCEVDLSTAILYNSIWSANKAVKIFRKIDKEGFEYDKHNHKCVYYPYFNFCFCYSGKHSINAGSELGVGKVVPTTVVNLEKLFPYIDVGYSDNDEVCWWNVSTNQELKGGYIKNFKLASLYSALRYKHGLENNIDYNFHNIYR